MRKITIIALTCGESYADFNTRGFFIGTREHLGDLFFDLNIDDDLRIDELAKGLDAGIRYYSVPMDAVSAFCHDYGTMPEPIELETNLRQTLFATDKGTFKSEYCTVNLL
jgi:hypothetical protein